MDECLSILRDDLAEFPQNERLMITLADTLSEAGWRRHHEWVYYDDNGYIRHDYDVNKQNPYWTEAIKLCKTLADSSHDYEIVAKAISILVLLYRNIGENDNAIAYANRMPELRKVEKFYLQVQWMVKKKQNTSVNYCLKLQIFFQNRKYMD